ncbi:MAG: PqqD family peptide modification chaperone [Candidatus Nanopelagicales bacterium]
MLRTTGLPTRNDGPELEPVVDGFIVRDESSASATWLNRTSALILELCTGHNSAQAIAAAIATAFELSEPPIAAVDECLDDLLAARLITYDTKSSRSDRASLLVCVTAPQGTVSAATTLALKSLAAFAEDSGFGLDVLIATEPSVRLARNRAASAVAQLPSHTHLLLLHTDTAFTPEQVERLLRSGHDVACLPQPAKQPNWVKVATAIPHLSDLTSADLADLAAAYAVTFVRSDEARIPVDGYLRADSVTADMLLISRQALLRMISEQTVRRYEREMFPSGYRENPGWGFFDPTISDRGFSLDEDSAFCHRWRSINGQIWVDLSEGLGRSIALALAQRKPSSTP